jgi:proteasome lid subunit RPN8/RPN11
VGNDKSHMAVLLKIARRDLDQIHDHALQGYPYEVCGLIGGRDDTAEIVVPVPNASLTPRVAYEMERQAMVDAIIGFQRAGREVVGIYHSHPDGQAVPSESDIGEATWPDVVWLIVGVTGDGEGKSPEIVQMRAWTIRGGKREAAEFEVLDPSDTGGSSE